MNKDTSRYEKRGVSSTKGDVHSAIKDLDKGLFPRAFCKILPDVLAGDPDYCNIQHADGAGTKSALAYLADLYGFRNVWRGIAQDSLVMNLDDLGCVGAMGPFLISQSVGRNKLLIPGEVIGRLINGCQDFCDQLTELGIQCVFSGGETSDVGDVVRTVIVDNTITVRMRRDEVIDASNMSPGDVIVGFSSTGQALWEKSPNSGIGSNGFTNARHDVLRSEYGQHHPETFSPEVDSELIYSGTYTLEDELPEDPSFWIGDALLSPTRTYMPLIKKLLAEVRRIDIHGLIHCSGGGQTKIGNFGKSGNVYIKDNLFKVPPLFFLLKNVQELPWSEMYSTYNMGHRLEAVVSETSAEKCIEIARACNIDARVVGRVESSNDPGRKVVITNGDGAYEYSFS